MKKNTLLYLDENLVKRAKRMQLNISSIAERAIKEAIYPSLSSEEEITIDFDSHLKNLEEEERCFFLPFEIKQVKLKNIGPIKEKTIDFENSNIITGHNASGKTTLLRSIAYLFNYKLDTNKIVNRDAYEDVVSGKDKSFIVLKIKFNDTVIARFGTNEKISKCVLIDDAGYMLTSSSFDKFLKYLKRLPMQVVLTSTWLKDDVDYKDINIIDMDPLDEESVQMVNVFKKLEEKYGAYLFLQHLERETDLKKSDLRKKLNKLKKNHVISEPKKDCFVRN